MKLHDLKPNDGSTKRGKRVGRGISAGQGKTAGRGTKGQGSRSGGSTPLYHQGGNLPFYRRLPFKRGFTPLVEVEYNEINLDQLDGFKAKSRVDPAALEAARLLRNPENPVVILGRGEVTKALTVAAHRVSAGARQKIEAAGGAVEILETRAE
jgi:large subunit ribosomal protein L15